MFVPMSRQSWLTLHKKTSLLKRATEAKVDKADATHGKQPQTAKNSLKQNEAVIKRALFMSEALQFAASLSPAGCMLFSAVKWYGPGWDHWPALKLTMLGA